MSQNILLYSTNKCFMTTFLIKIAQTHQVTKCIYVIAMCVSNFSLKADKIMWLSPVFQRELKMKIKVQ